MIRIGFSLLVFAVSPLSASEVSQRYLCVPEKSTGFYYDKSSGNWGSALVEEGARYVVEKTSNAAYAFAVSRIGKVSPEAFCVSGVSAAGYLACTGIDSTFSLDTHSGRYVRSSVVEYFKSPPELARVVAPSHGPITLSVGECLPVPRR